MENPINPIKMDDLGVPLFLETPMYDFEVVCLVVKGHEGWTP